MVDSFPTVCPVCLVMLTLCGERGETDGQCHDDNGVVVVSAACWVSEPSEDCCVESIAWE